MREIRTLENDTVNKIAVRELGSEIYTANIWEANPGLAARGNVFEAGVRVLIPEIVAAPQQSGTFKLWDD